MASSQFDRLKQSLPEQYHLYATMDTGAVLRNFEQTLDELNIELQEPFAGVVSFHCSPAKLTELSNVWDRSLSPSELAAIKCLLVGHDEAPSIAHLMHAQSLTDLKAWIDGQWLSALLHDRRLITYFQPIVHNAEPSRVFAYECLLRGVNEQGQTVMPGRILNAARATGLMQQVDQLAQLTAITTASRINLDTSIFVNFNPRFIDNPDYMKPTIDAIKESTIDPSRFVFEVVESDEIVAVERLLAVLEYCRAAGCGVALDDLGAGYSSLNLMAIVKPDFVKLDMHLIRNVDQDIYKSCVAAKLLELANELDVSTVVEGVETVGEWTWAIDHGADYAQGYLFARPDAIPPVPNVPCLPLKHAVTVGIVDLGQSLTGNSEGIAANPTFSG